ncbi:uncharacterized protein AMSG_02578 [Thecamonas trahens ATCC 50062]|uniref:RING-type domain-containing protein n=1 Tax=Thecamonas trahens ATCC 50062 TaxID=461836 RepID=A0A0L0D8B8_THETB|nr:hypothetical protein AMSG_02578 [Thecamonas trahens ATCC 50062]KNC47553.1 hypothetical protein AMSG_02578 [Thecamonas trahens ATCC 50062]|eukprot:XP_013759485.1 hypothetical protein AMSG_02578 [Thecamonas trahens ATCC 50062]
MLGFHFDDSRVELYSARDSGRAARAAMRERAREGNSSAASPSISFSKDQYVRASARFLVSLPLPARVAAMHTIDMNTDWDAIEAVLLFDDADAPLKCPICLDPPTIPQVTKCGHVYCYVCIVRFISVMTSGSVTSGRGCNADEDLISGNLCPCPMCEAHVSLRTLKSVVFEPVTSVARGARISLRKLVREVDSIVALPPGPDALAVRAANLLPGPNLLGPDAARFVRTLAADSATLGTLLHAEHAGLVAARAQFVSSGEPEFLPAVDLALERVADRIAAHAAAEEAKATGAPPESAAPHDAAASKTYTLYQGADGQMVFLDPFNIRMLFHEYGSYAAFPDSVSGRIVALHPHRQMPATRKRYKHLAHLPLTANFVFAELEFDDGILSPETLAEFAKLIASRSAKRRQADIMAERDAAAAATAREQSWRTRLNKPMPRYAAADFPTFGGASTADDDDDLLLAAAIAASAAAAASAAPPPQPELGSQAVNSGHTFTAALRGGFVSNAVMFPALGKPGAPASSPPPASPAAASSPPASGAWGSPRSHTSAAFTAPSQPIGARGAKGKSGKKGKKKTLLFTNSTTRGKS